MDHRVTTEPQCILPDYLGGSIVNLMASLGQRPGTGQDSYPPAGLLPPEEVRRSRAIVLLVIDGLGYHYLRARPGAWLNRNLRGSLTSVFPSTTATAVTSLLTGAAPGEHGITGWNMWLRELGTVVTILPYRMRYGGFDLAAAGQGPATLLGARPLFERLDSESWLLSPAPIVDSPFSQATARGVGGRYGYDGLEDLCRQIEALVRREGPRYLHAYWPEFDALAHRHGVSAPAVEAHFHALDQALEALADRLAGSDTLLLVTADHGFVDTGPDHWLNMADFPHIADCLSLPLCGEPRAAYCYVRADRARRFEQLVADELGEYCVMMHADDMVDTGLFGLGRPHPELYHRVGDYVLVMKDDWVIFDRLPGEKPFGLHGAHGGTSADEMLVPLVVAEL